MKTWTGLLLSSALLALPLPAGADQLSLNTYLQPPFSTPEGTGYFDKIVLELGHRTDIHISIKNLPIKRGLTITNQGLDDGHFPRVQSVADENENLFAIPVPLYRSTFVAITNAPATVVRNWSDLGKLRVGFHLGWKLYTDKQRHYGRAITARNGQELIEMLVRGTVDVLLSEVSYFAILAEAQGFSGYTVQSPPLAADDVFLLLHRRHHDKKAKLAAALSMMLKDGSLATLCPPCDQTMGLSQTSGN